MAIGARRRSSSPKSILDDTAILLELPRDKMGLEIGKAPPYRQTNEVAARKYDIVVTQ